MKSRSYLTTGRVNQKRRTREALIEVAAGFIRQGKNFSIADVAKAAGVGLTTTYRYFPTVDQLVTNAALWNVTGYNQVEFEHQFELSSSPYDNVDSYVVDSDRSTNKHRNEFRAMLRVSLDQNVQDGQRRARIRYFALKKALGDLEKKMDGEAFEQIVAAISLTVGIEAQIVLQDICALSQPKAREVKRWAARTLLAAALKEAGLPAAKATSARRE